MVDMRQEVTPKCYDVSQGNRPKGGSTMSDKFHLNSRFENGGFDAEAWYLAVTEPEDTGMTVAVRHRSEVETEQYAPSHCEWLVQFDTDHSVTETMKLWLTDSALRALTDAAAVKLWEAPVSAAAGEAAYETFDE